MVAFVDPKNSPHLFIMNAGSLGDTIAAIPTIRYAVNELFKKTPFQVLLPQEELKCLFDRVSDIPEGIVITDPAKVNQFTEPPMVHHYYGFQMMNADQQPVMIQLGMTNLRMGLVDYVSHKFLDRELPPEYRVYPKYDLSDINIEKFKLPGKYVCILATRLHRNRSMPEDVVYDLCDYFLARNITPVFIGKNVPVIDPLAPVQRYAVTPKPIPGVVDLNGQTTLLEAAKIMENASAVLGTDTGLIHLAQCTNANIIAAYTMVDPKYRVINIPEENVIVPEESSCRFCTSWVYKVNHSFNGCFQGEYQCIDAVSTSNFIQRFEQLGL